MMGFLTDMLEELILSFLEVFTSILDSFFDTIFNIEDTISTVIGIQVFENIAMFLYAIGLLLVVQKVLIKGFMIYVAWQDGDPDSEPHNLIINMGMAVIFVVSFPSAYQWFVDFFRYINNEVMKDLNSLYIPDNNLGDMLIDAVLAMSFSPVYLILYCVFLINLLILYFSFFKRGAEMLILRLGFPFVVSGWIDSDRGVFKPYIQQFIKTAFTVLIQQFCLQISIVLLINGVNDPWNSLCLSISFLFMANFAPALLSQFLIPSSGGGGMMQKAHTVSMTVNSIKSMIGK